MWNKLIGVSTFVRRVCIGVGLLMCVLLVHAEKLDLNTKKTIGTITSLEAGDVACYISMKDEQGVEFHEMGDFMFCENPDAWVGKRVKLTYEASKVLADQCEGNPDCGVFKDEALIKDMDVIVVGK